MQTTDSCPAYSILLLDAPLRRAGEGNHLTGCCLLPGPPSPAAAPGALLNDGISGIFSALATSLPLTTFAQNNGVISLTNVAARHAGFSCAGWLLLLGVLGKIGAWWV